jgi:hypothetical protein
MWNNPEEESEEMEDSQLDIKKVQLGDKIFGAHNNSTQTSPDKYLEVTFKNGEENIFKKIKPGETIEICAYCNKQPPVIVREREITNE